MKPQFLNLLASSFMLWIDHEILDQGESFANFSGQLYAANDPNLKGAKVYGSQFRQWVSDSSIQGATIASGVFAGSNFVAKGVSGLNVDYNMGRVVFNHASVPSNLTNLTLPYSFKEFNTYLVTEDEVDLLFEKKWEQINQLNTSSSPVSALKFNEQPYPCVYIKQDSSENQPFAFGGQDATNTSIRAIVLTENSWQMDGLLSILNDSARKSFPVLDLNEIPYNRFGDFKQSFSGSYSYVNLCASSPNHRRLSYIKKVRVTKFDEDINKELGPKVRGAFVDFDLENIRYPRSKT